MKIDNKEVKRIAELAMLKLSKEEENTLSAQLEKILNWVDKLKEVDTDNISPTSSVIGMPSPARSAVPRKFENTKDILANAPEREYDFFKVKKVIGDE